MNRIKTFLFAIVVMMGATGIITSCQEDAPVINYTMTVTVTNDFSTVVEAIENGFLKNEDAVNRLAEAIDKMNRDQAGKLQAIIDVLNSVTATLNTKIAALEAAMHAQTLSVEGKLELIKTAIEAIPDYSAKLEAIAAAIEAIPDYSEKIAALEAAMQSQTLSVEGKLELIKTAIEAIPDYSEKIAALEAAMHAQTLSVEGKLELIKTAIEAIPDYSDKFEAIVSALDAMKTQMEALDAGQTAIAAQIANVITAINALITDVNSGNTDSTKALSDIVAMLEELKVTIAYGECVFIIDGVTKKLFSTVIDESDYINNHYDIILFLEGKGELHLMAEKTYHDGKSIDLTNKEHTHPDGKWYWVVSYSEGGTILFEAYAKPSTSYVVFQSGTLYLRCLTEEDGKPVFEILLENGKIKDDYVGDGHEHTVSLNFKGKLQPDEI